MTSRQVPRGQVEEWNQSQVDTRLTVTLTPDTRRQVRQGEVQVISQPMDTLLILISRHSVE